MAFFIDEKGTYYSGDIEYERARGVECTEVPQIPSRCHEWDFEREEWAENKEVKEAQRKNDVQSQITELYSMSVEMKIQREAVNALANSQEPSKEYRDYNVAVEMIIAESHDEGK